MQFPVSEPCGMAPLNSWQAVMADYLMPPHWLPLVSAFSNNEPAVNRWSGESLTPSAFVWSTSGPLGF